MRLSDREQQELLELLDKEKEHYRYNKAEYFFAEKRKINPETGKIIHPIGDYPKHKLFMDAGYLYKERAFIAGNRCLAAGTMVSMADGTRKPIEAVKIGESVMAYDIASDSMVETEVIDTFKGYADNMVSFSVNGVSITCTDDHPFLHKKRYAKKRTIREIVSLKDPQIVVPHRWNPKVKTPAFSHDVARLIGYLIGDGGLTQDSPRFTNTNEAYHSDVASISKSMGLWYRRQGCDGYIAVRDGVKGGNPLTNLLKDLGLWKTNCRNKFIPRALLVAPIEWVIELVKGLFATDGCIERERITYYSVSKELIDGIQTLLWRLGIRSTGRVAKVHKGVPQYVLQVSMGDINRFPLIPGKQNLNYHRSPRTRDTYRVSKIQNYRPEKPQDIYCITVSHPDHLFIANGLITSNTGKTFCLAYEFALHATGQYPKWWKGHRFIKPPKAYVVGHTNESTRDVLQVELFGKFGEPGTGLIAADRILETKSRPGLPNGLSYAKIKWGNGKEYSEVFLRSYEQGIKSFMGTAMDLVFCDEEPPADIYSELVTRTMTTNGIIMCSFTPLSGFSDVVNSFLNNGKFPIYDNKFQLVGGGNKRRYVVNVTWDDVPHLTETEKSAIWEATPAYLRASRKNGTPTVGQGKIYPVSEEDILIEPFQIPVWWPRIAGMDVGWNRTSVVWGAIDTNSNITYLYDEYSRGQAEPSVHAFAIRQRGEGFPIFIDPAARGRSQVDGSSLMDLYQQLGLELYKANNSVDAGIYTCFQRLSGGKTKVFKTLNNWIGEYRFYQYNEQGKPKKEHDHSMDAWRYMEMGIEQASLLDCPENREDFETSFSGGAGRSKVTGY